MKKLLIFLSVLLVPFVAKAAYNDVSVAVNTIVNVASINLTVSGSESAVVESITANTNDLSFVLRPNSFIQFTSTDRRILSGASSNEFSVSSTCTASEAVTTFTSVADMATVTATPAAAACTVAADAATPLGSGSSGGGGGSTVSTVPTVSVPVPTFVATSQPSFARNLSVGSTGAEVTALQQVLVSEGFLVMPVGVSFGYYGSLTTAGIKAYQAKYGIEQVGVVGPITRAQLNKGNAVGAGATVSSQLSPAQISVIVSQINALLQQVQVLQAKLKALAN